MDNNSIMSIVAIVAVFGIMYAVLIIPQRRREKKTKEMLNALGEGDVVTTIGGITGKVININDDEVTVASGVEATKVLLKKWAIKGVEKAADSE